MKNFYALLMAVIWTSVFSSLVAQVTTANLTGLVAEKGKDEPLIGAAVTALHTPSGTKYAGVTLEDGRYTLSNLRIGGPYTITASFVGYESRKIENVYLSLGQKNVVNIELESSSQQLNEVVISADQNALINGDRTGAETRIGNAQITQLPTVNRSFQDFTRLTPQSSGGFSFGGRNRLYNNLTIDGSIFNNAYGLDASTPGGQTKSQPMSLDAFDEISVAIAPFDVTQGSFTGAAINAVTKSGTNEFKGSVYTYFKNESLIGRKVGDVELVKSDLNFLQPGISIGGPLIKDKLFFFVSAELEREKQPATTYVAYRPGQNDLADATVSNVLASDLDIVQQTLKDVYSYDPGAYENYEHQRNNDKISAKIDWNINNSHNFNIVYKKLNSFRDVLPNPAISVSGRGPNKNTLPFENNSYIINNNFNSIVAELNSRFKNKFANKLQVGYTAFRDFRDSKSASFPSVDILQNGQNYISFGLERFSTNNLLNTDVFQLTDNFNIYLPKHTLTIGTSYEYFKFLNSFNLFYYPGVTFASMDEFVANTNPNSPNFVDMNAQVTTANQNPLRADETPFSQLSVYAQDEWQASNNFRLTAGVRADVAMYDAALPDQPAVEQLTFYDPNTEKDITNFKVNQYPNTTVLLSPRLGFNWDIKGNQSTQLRGGTGIFTGRIPFVWLGNQTANQALAPFYTFQLNATASDFKFPQVWKSNLGYDQKLPGDITLTVDFIFGKDLNAVVHQNYNMRRPTGTADGAGNGGDTRAIFQGGETKINVLPATTLTPTSVADTSFLDAGLIVLNNTNKGYHYNITGQLTKRIGKNFFASVGYSFGEAKDITSNPGEIAANAFQTNPVVGDPNKPQLSFSDFDLRHRLVGGMNYKKEYAKHFATGIGVFFERLRGGIYDVIGEVGGRYSYTYAGDMNNDGIAGNDLLYIPANQNDIILVANDATDTRTATEIWQQLDSFIEQDPYLSENRGKYAERNGALVPAYGRFDLKLTQDFYFNVAGKRNTLQFTFDVLNFGNLLNPNWGIKQTAANRKPLTFMGYNADGEPTFSFPLDASGQPLKESFINDTSLNSRWQGQIGIRYIFN